MSHKRQQKQVEDKDMHTIEPQEYYDPGPSELPAEWVTPTDLKEEDTPAMTPDTREDEKDAKDAEEARQIGESIRLNTHIVTQEQGDPAKCQSRIVLGVKDYYCGQPIGHRGAHGARGQALLCSSGIVCDIKLLWDEVVEPAG